VVVVVVVVVLVVVVGVVDCSIAIGTDYSTVVCVEDHIVRALDEWKRQDPAIVGNIDLVDSLDTGNTRNTVYKINIANYCRILTLPFIQSSYDMILNTYYSRIVRPYCNTAINNSNNNYQNYHNYNNYHFYHDILNISNIMKTIKYYYNNDRNNFNNNNNK
jgi:hypothetical protein